MDLGSLAALMAIANDPQATQTAREFLSQQKLQNDRLKVEQGMREAELQLQENANRRQSEAQAASLGENQRQFNLEQTATKDYRKSTLNQGQQQIDLQAKGLDAEAENRRKSLSIQQQGLDLQKEDSFRKYLSDAQGEYVSLRKGSGTSGIKPPSMQELTGVFQSLAPEVFSPTQNPKWDKKKQADYNDTMHGKLKEAVANYYAATGQQVSPEAGLAAFEGRNSFIEMKAAGLRDPAERQAFLDSFQKWEGSTAGQQAMGVSPSHEQSKAFFDQTALKIATRIESGGELSSQEQADIAWHWDSIQDPTLKAQYVDSVVNTMAKAFQMQRGWTDQQALEWNGNFRAILSNVVQSGDGTRFSPYIMGGGPVEGPSQGIQVPLLGGGSFDVVPGSTHIGPGLKALGSATGLGSTMGERKTKIQRAKEERAAREEAKRKNPGRSVMEQGLGSTIGQAPGAFDTGIQHYMSAEGYDGTMGGITRARREQGARERQKKKLTPKRGY